jgi:hypothetical protein
VLGLRLGRPAQRALDDQGPEDDRDQDQDQHGVDHRLVEQPDVEADHRGREGGGRLGHRQPQHQPRLGSGVAEHQARHPRGQHLAAEAGGDEKPGELQRLALDHHLRVEEHPHRDQEDGHEHCRAEEVDPVHQRPLVGHQPVERQAGEEGADDRLDAEALGDRRRGQEGRDRDQVADHPIGPQVPEPERRQSRQEPEREGDQDRQADHDLERDRGRRAAGELRARDPGQHHQGGGVGEHRRSDGGRHPGIGRQPRLAHGGIDEQRLGGEQRA